LGTTGEFVGISQTTSTLFFIDHGSGDHHSFQTQFDNISMGNIIKNEVTVLTESNHSLEKGDKINLNIISGLSTTIVLKYNDYNQKLVINPRTFSYIDFENNLITIENHNYKTGQKLIHTSLSPANGLENEKIYYAIVYDKDRISLSHSYYGATSETKSIVNITSSSFGTLSQINPKINILKNQRVVINLSDPSLSQNSSGIGRTPSFDFDLFLDENFTSKYFPVNNDGISKISRFGVIGVSTFARIEFTVDSEFPKSIWYNLVPRVDINLTESRKQYVADTELNESNKISFENSDANGEKIIVGVSSNSFSFYDKFYTELNNSPISSIDYYTNSLNEVGQIQSVKIISGGKGYTRLPSISSVSSAIGSGAILLPNSKTIGQINSTNIIDIGYNYSVDNTIRPTIKYPTILRVEPLTTLESVTVIYPGLNYNTSPDLVVIDGFTNKVVNDIVLDYDIETSKVKILRNTKGLYNTTPKVVAVNNSNGLGISSVQYNSSSKIVRVYLTKQFSDPNNFPFSIGDNVLIEGISTIEKNTIGYNSKNYNYSLFPVVGVNTSLGGSGAYVEYKLDDDVLNNKIPGTYDLLNSAGQIIAERFLPKFKVILTKNSFIIGESIEQGDGINGKVLKFDKNNEFLTIETKNEFSINSLITGNSSKSQAFIREIFGYEGSYKINSSSIVEHGWNKQTGFLNNDQQRIQNSDYYQYFSYSLKSEVSIEEWNDVVNNLNHTLGFKKFSDLILNSSARNNLGISTAQNDGSFSAVCDLNSVVDIECTRDYDLASENNFYIDGILTSSEINFNSVILQDYSESIGNRVLKIDDISGDFNTSVTRTFVTSFNI
jgi:hypothetical protein